VDMTEPNWLSCLTQSAAKNEDAETSGSATRVMRLYEQSKGMPN